MVVAAEGDSILRYSDELPKRIQLARDRGMSDTQIIRIMMQCRTAADVREHAKRYAHLFGLTPSQFVRVARMR